MYNTTYDFDIKEKQKKKNRCLTYLALCMVIVGAGMLIGGGIWYNATEDSRSYVASDLEEIDKTIDGSTVKKLDLDISAGTANISISGDDKVHIQGTVSKDYVCEEKDGTLRIDTGDHGLHFNLGWNDGDFGLNIDKHYVDILIPEKEYEKLKVDLSAGNITIDGADFKKTDIEISAGELTIDNVKSTDTMKINMSAGEANIQNTTTGGLDIDLSAGDLSYSGKVNGNIKVDCSAGDCNIDLINKKSEFNKLYKIDKDVSAGDVSINFAD